jgi:hypothetical protein
MHIACAKSSESMRFTVIINKLCIFRPKIYRKYRKAHRTVKILNLIQVKL